LSTTQEADFAPLEELAAQQSERWRQQYRYVLKNSPFFSALWSESRASPRLEDLPLLPLCDKEMLHRSQAEAPPFGNFLAAPESSVVRVHRSSGTTGRTMNLVLSAADAQQTAVVGARAQRASGLGPQHRVVHCLNYQLWMGGFTDHTILEMTGATVIPFGVGNSELLVHTIRELGITAISCTPSYPLVLERVIEERFAGLSPRDLGLELGLFGGEAGLDDDGFRKRLETTWGFAARNANYGTSDVMCNFAGQCGASNDLHFVALDVLYPELVDPVSDQSLPWQEGAEGELVLTHLARQCQPLVRFRTADIILLTGTGPCTCGRTSPRFRVIGRRDDMVVVRGINVFPTSVAVVINQFSEFSGEYRIVLEGSGPYERLPLEVELNTGQRGGAALEAALTESIRRALHVTPQVTLAPPNSLPRNEGKTRRVIRKEKK
jgi:phenylacetate-CoA ligase